MKKLFGKRAIALLTTMAILVSLVAMLAGLTVTSGATYTPKRVMSYTAGGTQIEGKLLITGSGDKLGANRNVVVKGYVKVENYVAKNTTDHNVQVGAGGGATGGLAITADCDWTPFEVNYTTSNGNWLKFGFWYAQGTMSIADLTIEEDGVVIYDMATDADLIAGTYDADKQPATMGMWYIGYFGDKSEISCTIDPVYVPAAPAYEPKRAVTITTSEGIHQACLMLADAYKVAPSQTITISGYYKVDSLSGSSFSIGGTSVSTDAATDGWVAFSFDYAAPAGEDWKSFGIYSDSGDAAGTFAVADITFTNSLGQVVYDMATDAALSAGTYNYTKSHGYDKLSLFYLMGTYGGNTKADATATIVVDPVYTEPYAPKRTISMTTAGSQINGKIYLYNSEQLGAGKNVTVSGYFKVDNYASARDDHNITTPGGTVKGNCDWTPFTKSFTTGSGNNLSLEFWYAQGTVSFADVVIYEGENLIYDMTIDEDLVAGTYDSSNWAINQGIWYFGFYSQIDAASYTIDPIYVPETYTPKRVISMTAGGTQINGKICLYNSNLLGSGKTVTVKGYYKIENYSAWADRTQGDQKITMAGNVHTADCGWTEFEKTITTGAGHSLCFEYWYAQGTISVADVTVKEVDGDYLYDMAVDEDLVAGTYDINNWKLNQSLFYFGYYSAMSDTTYTIGEKAESGLVIIPPPYDPELVELPEIPNMITADKNGYTPNRAFAVINGVHKNPKASYAVFADETNYAVAGNKYYVFLKYRVYSLAEGVSANIKINGTTVLTATETTDAWVQLLDENGKPYSFEAVEVDDIISFIFDMNGAGCFAVADFIVANQKGEIVYSLANDKTMHIETDLRYISNGYWKGDPYVADKAGPTLFPIQTKCETYKPSATVTLTQNDKKKGTTAEAFLYFRTNNALFTAGQTYTITGMFKSEIVCGYNGNANPTLKFSDSTGAAQIADIANHGTNGNWYPLLTPEGKPLTFKGTPEEDWMKINLYCTYGSISLADIVITDAQGNVVYDMAADTELKAAVGEFTGNVADIGGPLLRHALYKNGVGEVWFAETAQNNTETSKQIPQFEESVEIPVEECEHDFVDGTCTKCGEADPDYEPPVDDPCANGHNYVDGFCTECGDEDPNYNPGGEGPIEPPAQTGDESMIFVAALAMFAVAALAVLTLNKKKFN